MRIDIFGMPQGIEWLKMDGKGRGLKTKKRKVKVNGHRQGGPDLGRSISASLLDVEKLDIENKL